MHYGGRAGIAKPVVPLGEEILIVRRNFRESLFALARAHLSILEREITVQDACGNNGGARKPETRG